MNAFSSPEHASSLRCELALALGNGDAARAVSASFRTARSVFDAVVHRRKRHRTTRAHFEFDSLAQPAAIASGSAGIRTQLAPMKQNWRYGFDD
jgi:hypothetical protein